MNQFIGFPYSSACHGEIISFSMNTLLMVDPLLSIL
ncbi:hypothetical protein EDE15_3852 [Edaphobacter aggregans]|uniref:Uncharacterized protein n=1 Tax=Edaphobacter aggregans TaxID=570835 RepID=A0A428MN34_9BACT|nr:hypothetical protein EDE15_3852 [Edaphobacter aggregans]